MNQRFILFIFLGLFFFTSLQVSAFDGDLSVLKHGKRIKVATNQGTFKFRFDHIQGDSVLVVRHKKVYHTIKLTQIKRVYVDKRCVKQGIEIGRTTGEFLGLIAGFGFAIALEVDQEALMYIGEYSFGMLLQLPGALVGLAFPHWVEI